MGGFRQSLDLSENLWTGLKTSVNRHSSSSPAELEAFQEENRLNVWCQDVQH